MVKVSNTGLTIVLNKITVTRKQWLIRKRISRLPGGCIRIHGPEPGEDIHRGDPWSVIPVDILDPPPENIRRGIRGDPWSVIPMDILDPRFLGYPRVDPRWSEIPVDRGWSVNFFENWHIYTENHTYIKLNKFNYLHLILILTRGYKYHKGWGKHIQEWTVIKWS